MITEPYDTGKFKSQYIENCSSIGHPLSKEQINALEKTVSEFFPPPMDYRILNQVGRELGYTQPARILTLVRAHRYRNPYSQEPGQQLVTDVDALNLYRDAVELIKTHYDRIVSAVSGLSTDDLFDKRGIRAGPLKHTGSWHSTMPRGLSFDLLKILEEYLHRRGLLTKKEMTLKH